jgi:DNA primase
VAILGAKNWSDYKLKLILQKAPSTVWLSLDNDTAGNDAMKALYAKLRRYFNVKLIELPPGNDPFDLIPESLAEIYQAVWSGIR